MQKDFVASVEKMNKAAVESVKRLGEIQLRSMERMTEMQIEMTSDYLNQGVKQLQSLAATKDIQGALDSQIKYVARLNEQAVENAKKTADMLTELKTDLAAWVEEGVKAASENPLAKAVGKKAA